MKYVARAFFAVVLLASLAWGGVVGYLWLNETRIVFRAHLSARRDRALDLATFSPVHLVASDGVQLEAIATPANEAPYWILFFPGSGNSVRNSRVQTQLEQLFHLGYGVMALDYRGFGGNPGTPTERSVYEDALVAYDHLTDHLRIAPSRVILSGRSLGSAVAVEVATRVPTAGVLLLSPIDSIPLMGERLYPWMPVGLLASSRFDSMAKVKQLHTPVVVVHALNDRFVPITAARALFQEAAGPKLMLETDGGHNGAGFSSLPELDRALETFWPSGLLNEKD